MNIPVSQDHESALAALADMAARSRQAQAKFAPGTAQHTLQTNRIHALHVAAALVARALAGDATPIPYTKEALQRAQAPLASLTGKSEKAQMKVAPGTWQHAMLGRNLAALHLAAPLLAQALNGSDAKVPGG